MRHSPPNTLKSNVSKDKTMDAKNLYDQLKTDGYDTLISKKEYLKITGISKSTLDLNMQNQQHIPPFMKIGDPIKGRVLFNLRDVCDFLCSCSVRVA